MSLVFKWDLQNLNAAMDSYMLAHLHLVPDWILFEVRIYIWWNQWHSAEKSEHLYRNKVGSNFNNLKLNLISRATQYLCCLISLLFARWKWLLICFAHIYPANCTLGIYVFIYSFPNTQDRLQSLYKCSYCIFICMDGVQQ